MSKISLKHSGGNVVSLNSPTNAPSSADVAFKLPNADGSDGQALVTDGLGNLSFSNVAATRNLIINGAMNVAQRATTSTTSGYGSVDRFQVLSTGVDEAPTHAQVGVATNVTPYTLGFRNALKVTNGNQTSGAGASDFIKVQQNIEGQDINRSGWNLTDPNSKLTISYWVKSSVAQTFYGRFRAFASSEYEYTYSFALSADTWTKVTKTIPGNSNFSSLVDTNASGFFHIWQCFFGTDFTNNKTLDEWAVKDNANKSPDMTSTWYTTNNATFELTGVQLEVGSVATDFEHRSFGDELAKCQRYFYQATKIGSSSEVTNMPIAPGFYLSSNDYRAIIDFPVEMRAAPTLSSNDDSGSFYIHTNATADTIDRLDSFQNTKRRSIVRNTAHASGTQGYFGMLHQETGDSNLNFSAEL